MRPPCKHCFRGDAERVELNENAVDNLLNQVKSINELCFTGGEPMLSISSMQYIFRTIQVNNVRLGRVSLVTNGLLAPKKFISLMLDIEAYISRKGETPCIEIGVSCDRYHRNNNGDEFISACSEAFRGKSIAVLKQMTGANPLRTGKAEGLGAFETTIHRQPLDVASAVEISNECRIETQLYLSAKGMLYTGAIATNTYQYIDNAPMICNMNDIVDLMQAVNAYNKGRTPAKRGTSEKTLAEVFTENVNLYIRMLIVVQNPLYGFSESDRRLATKDLAEIGEIYNDYDDISISAAVMIWLDGIADKSFAADSHKGRFAQIREKALAELAQM